MRLTDQILGFHPIQWVKRDSNLSINGIACDTCSSRPVSSAASTVLPREGVLRVWSVSRTSADSMRRSRTDLSDAIREGGQTSNSTTRPLRSRIKRSHQRREFKIPEVQKISTIKRFQGDDTVQKKKSLNFIELQHKDSKSKIRQRRESKEDSQQHSRFDGQRIQKRSTSVSISSKEKTIRRNKGTPRHWIE